VFVGNAVLMWDEALFVVIC